MIEQSKENIERAIGRIREIGGDRIAFIALYGSIAKNRDTHLSDIDLAVFYEGSKEERFKFRIYINTIKNFDDFTRHLNLYYSYSGGVSIE
jgi:predicted nucleotidyltransferase